MKSTSLPRGARFAFLILASAASTAAKLAFGAPADSTEVTAPQMIDAFEGDFGVHPGQRRNHTKGLCAAGEFVGTTDAAALSRSALFSGKTIPVVARFSLGGGDPEVPDRRRIWNRCAGHAEVALRSIVEHVPPYSIELAPAFDPAWIDPLCKMHAPYAAYRRTTPIGPWFCSERCAEAYRRSPEVYHSGSKASDHA